MENKIILDILYGKRKEYGSAKFVLDLLQHNEEFKKIITEGIKTNKIKCISEDTWIKLQSLNLRAKATMEEIFESGMNIGACTTMARYFSFVFNGCYIVGGTNKYLIGTKNSAEGEHTWIIGSDGKIYDTTFLFCIEPDYAIKLGYNEEGKYNPEFNPNYASEKDFALDPSIKRR